MSEIRLAILNDEIAFPSFLSDADNLREVPLPKLGKLIDWVITALENSTSFMGEDLTTFATEYGFSNASKFASALRIITFLLNNGFEFSPEDLDRDLQKLRFETESRKAIIESLNKNWQAHKEYLKRERTEVLPELTGIHWRVDNRVASSDYLEKQETIVILRLSANESGKAVRLTLELDLDDIIWLEKELGKMKARYLRANELHNPH